MNDTDALATRVADFDREQRRVEREAEKRGVADSSIGGNAGLLQRRVAFRELQDEARYLGFGDIAEFRESLPSTQHDRDREIAARLSF